jgi:hypothetical protein
MSQKFIVCDKPCATCPYRKDTPPGVWDRSEYEKLPGYDEPIYVIGPDGNYRAVREPKMAIFKCHYSPSLEHDAVCRGWLTVHRESVAVRLAMAIGTFTPEQVYAEPLVELYASGQEACDAGIAGCDQPSIAAIRKIDALEARLGERVPKTGYERKTRDGKSGQHYDTHPKSKKSKRHKRAKK